MKRQLRLAFMNVPLSAKVFWTTTGIALSWEIFWFIRENVGVIDWPGIPIYLALASPELLGIACGVALLVTCLYGLIVLLVLRRSATLFQPLGSKNARARVIVAIVLGALTATTASFVLDNYTHAFSSIGGSILLWWSVCRLVSFALNYVHAVVLRRKRSIRTGNHIE